MSCTCVPKYWQGCPSYKFRVWRAVWWACSDSFWNISPKWHKSLLSCHRIMAELAKIRDFWRLSNPTSDLKELVKTHPSHQDSTACWTWSVIYSVSHTNELHDWYLFGYFLKFQVLILQVWWPQEAPPELEELKGDSGLLPLEIPLESELLSNISYSLIRLWLPNVNKYFIWPQANFAIHLLP